jgi:L-seryl-tRNA(Ser) seleniumtransferase
MRPEANTLATKPQAKSQSDWGEIYRELGAKPIINAIGSVTLLGGSTPVPEVKEAMERADSAYVPLWELEEKAGDYIAELVGVPAAYITSGAGSALTLATAAFMAGEDDDRIQQLPDTTGMKNEILIQRRQRYWYDRCLQLAGAKLVEFGTAEKTTEADLEKAIGPKTVAVHYFMVTQNPDPNALSLESTIKVARKHKIKVLVDAAGQIYPLDLLADPIKKGADISCVAAKYMYAPQSTGFAFGTKESIRALAKQTFIGYETRRVRGIGRPQKIDRQEIIGATVALKRWMTMDHEERLASIESRSRTIARPIQGIKGVKAELIDNIVGQQPYGVKLTLDAKVAAITINELVDELKTGDPPIWTRMAGDTGDTMFLHIFGLNEGEEKIVGERIASILKKRARK